MRNSSARSKQANQADSQDHDCTWFGDGHNHESAHNDRVATEGDVAGIESVPSGLSGDFVSYRAVRAPAPCRFARDRLGGAGMAGVSSNLLTNVLGLDAFPQFTPEVELQKSIMFSQDFIMDASSSVVTMVSVTVPVLTCRRKAPAPST